jgi:hypothetical protein
MVVFELDYHLLKHQQFFPHLLLEDRDY